MQLYFVKHEGRTAFIFIDLTSPACVSAGDLSRRERFHFPSLHGRREKQREEVKDLIKGHD
jgi:hypothetical protein